MDANEKNLNVAMNLLEGILSKAKFEKDSTKSYLIYFPVFDDEDGKILAKFPVFEVTGSEALLKGWQVYNLDDYRLDVFLSDNQNIVYDDYNIVNYKNTEDKEKLLYFINIFLKVQEFKKTGNGINIVPDNKAIVEDLIGDFENNIVDNISEDVNRIYNYEIEYEDEEETEEDTVDGTEDEFENNTSILDSIDSLDDYEEPDMVPETEEVEEDEFEEEYEETTELEEVEETEEDTVLPGMGFEDEDMSEFENEETVEEEMDFSKLDELDSLEDLEDEEELVLPGMGFEDDDELAEEFEEIDEVEEDDEFEEIEEEASDDLVLPGMDLDEDDVTLPGFEEDAEEDEEEFEEVEENDEFEEIEEEASNDLVLPGMDLDDDDLVGFEEDKDEEVVEEDSDVDLDDIDLEEFETEEETEEVKGFESLNDINLDDDDFSEYEENDEAESDDEDEFEEIEEAEEIIEDIEEPTKENNILLNFDEIAAEAEVEDVQSDEEDADLELDIEEDNELEDMFELVVGMDSVKEKVLAYQKYANFIKTMNLSTANLNLAFVGNKGTGKSVIANSVTEMLYDMDMIAANRLVKVNKKELCMCAHNSNKFDSIIESAMGGVLLVDEACKCELELDPDVTVKILHAMENGLVVIFSGCSERMNDFLKINREIASKISYVIDFPDYTADQLAEIIIFKLQFEGLNVYADSRQAIKDLMYYFEDAEGVDSRFTSKVFQSIIVKHSAKLTDDVTAITKSDIPTVEDMLAFVKSDDKVIVSETVKAIYNGNVKVIMTREDKIGVLRTKEEKTDIKSELINKLTGLLVGMAAEEIYFGEYNHVESLLDATKLAKYMVRNGMSDLGLARINKHEPGMSEVIYEATNKLLDKCYNLAKEYVQKNKKNLDNVIEYVRTHNEVTGETLFKEFENKKVVKVEKVVKETKKVKEAPKKVEKKVAKKEEKKVPATKKAATKTTTVKKTTKKSK